MGKLIKYEFKKEKVTYIVLFSIIVLIELYYLLGLANKDAENLVIALGLLIFVGSFGILAIMLIGAISYGRELNSKFSYMTFMTPNSTKKIVGAKYLSLLILTAVSSAVYIGCICFDYNALLNTFTEYRDYRNAIWQITNMMGYDTSHYVATFVGTLVTVWLSMFFAVSCAYMSITLSTTALANKKGKGFLSVVFFIIIYTIVMIIMSHIPTMTKVTGETVYGLKDSIFKYIFEVATIAGTFFFVSYMLDKKVSL